MAKRKIGKIALQTVVTALLSAIILAVVGGFVGLIAPIGGILNELLIALVSAGFFIWAMAMNPGKEEFLKSIPIIIVSTAIVGLVRALGVTIIPSLSVPITYSGLAFGLGSVFLATMITKKLIR